MNNTNFTNYDRWKTTPPEQPSVLIGYDWLNNPIYSDDNDEYIEHEGDLILDEPAQIRAYLLKLGRLVDTMELYREM